jgi:hypothetical protein
MQMQREAMVEMQSAAEEKASVAMAEVEAATTDGERSDAKRLLQKAVMHQQELAVQEMQQSVMMRQQAMSVEQAQQQRRDAADARIHEHTLETMSAALKLSEEAAVSAGNRHDAAMNNLVEHSEAMQAAIGDADAMASRRGRYDEAVVSQRSAHKSMLEAREAVVEMKREQEFMRAALDHQRATHDADATRRMIAMSKAQTNLHERQAEVNRLAAEIQAGPPINPTEREITADEAQLGYNLRAGASGSSAGGSGSATGSNDERKASSANRDESADRALPAFGGRGGAAKASAPVPSMNEEWEIDFSEIVFPPHGVPSSENRIGHGGFGEVFLGQLGGMNVAVKKLFNQDVAEQGMREFREEVSILSRLRHPSIVLWLGASTRAPNCTIVLEYMDRGSLSQVLHRSSSPYALQTAVKWCISIARGMLYLHKHKPYPIIHCDLNSNNVLVNRDWVVKITDFGLSKVKRTSRLSRRSGIIGTVNYAAPEVIRGATASERSDVYAFGVLAWEIFTRKVPWKDLTEYQIIYKMTASVRQDASKTATIENFDISPDLPPGTGAILHACWSAVATERPMFPRLVDEFREMLRQIPKEEKRETNAEGER